MNASEALNIVKRLKGHYQAFEKIEELLSIADNVERMLGEQEGKKNRLIKAIESLKTEFSKHKDDFDSFKEKMKLDTRNANQTYANLTSKLNEEYKNQIHVLQKQKAEIIKEVEEAQSLHNKKMTEIKKEQDKAETALENANSALSDMKGKLQALG